jgi:peptidoglycan hydrolase CwlO-like protein
MRLKISRISVKKYTNRIGLCFLAVIVALTISFQIMIRRAGAVCSTAAQCQAQIAALESNITAYQAEAVKLNAQAQTLQNELAKLASEKAVIQSQIDISQYKYDQLVIQIADIEKQISDRKDALGVTIANLYVDDNITPVEMLFGSKNISDYMDKQEYRDSVRDELVSNITKIKDLKTQLETQKSEVEKVLGDQKNARQALANKEAEQKSILDTTKGQESAYQQLMLSAEADKEAAAAAYKELTRPRSGSGSTGISDPAKGNYPWGGDNCYIGSNMESYNGYDGNGGDPLGYACRQCTSYTAWKILEYTGRGYSYWGNAKMWPNSARNNGISTGYEARAHSAGVMTGGPWGHVVWVETDPDANGKIIISQYNSYYDNTGDSSGAGWGNYSKKLVNASDYDEFIYF